MNCPFNHDKKAAGLELIGAKPAETKVELIGLRKNLPVLPLRMAHLPIDKRGFPVPWFVQWFDGVPDFRIMDQQKFVKAIKFNLCWCCGGQLGVNKTFVAGPMCGINRTSAEPPAHKECAEYSAKACPFLSQPKMKRNEKGLPDCEKPPGEFITRNPGVTMLWTTKEYKPFLAGDGILIDMGEPSEVEWYCQGRKATREEVTDSISEGLPALEHIARQDEGGMAALAEACSKIIPLLPQDPPPSLGVIVNGERLH